LTISKTGTTGPTDGHTGGDKHHKKTTGTTETTDGQTGSDKTPNKATGTTGHTGGQTGLDKHPNKTRPIVPVVLVLLLEGLSTSV
jgi:hypothetical protein